MIERTAFHRVERTLYILAAGLFVGTILELIMLGHDEGTMQLVPFALCGIGLVGIGLARFFPTNPVQRLAQALMATIAAGSLLGAWEHIEGNLGFLEETRPNADAMMKVRAALTGQAPPLAPGMLALGGILAAVAIYATRSLAAPVVATETRRAAQELVQRRAGD